MSISVVGDELHWDGYLVGHLAVKGVPATVMANLVDHIEGGCLDEDEDDEGCGGSGPTTQEEEDEIYEGALDDVLDNMKPFNITGFVKYADLERIVAQLKEEGAHEAAVS